MTRVLLLFADTTDPATALDAALGAADASAVLGGALGAPAELALITMTPPASVPAGVQVAHTLGTRRAVIDRIGPLAALRTRLSRFPAGRLLNSVGPIDLSRVFWRSLRADPAAMALTDGGTIVIAADLPAARAAYGMLRTGHAARAFWGLRGAVDQLKREPR